MTPTSKISFHQQQRTSEPNKHHQDAMDTLKEQ